MPSLSESLQTFSAVVVTGGSSGIGKSFIELGAKLAPGLRFCNLSRRAPAAEVDPLILRHVPCDLSSPADVDRAAAEVTGFIGREVPGRILLINNSGFGAYGRFPEPNLSHQLEMLDVNIRALVQLTGLLLPFLKERGGAIMNIASTAAFQPTPFLAAYGASKAFVLHWSLALNEELRGSGVHALAVCPGPTSTEFFRRAGLQKGSVADSLGMTAEAVVLQSYQALAKRRAQVVTGWKNKLMAAFSSRVSKPLATAGAALILKRYRLKQVKR